MGVLLHIKRMFIKLKRICFPSAEECSKKSLWCCSILSAYLSLIYFVATMSLGSLIALPFFFLLCWGIISKIYVYINKKIDFIGESKFVISPPVLSLILFSFYCLVLYLHGGVICSTDTIAQWKQVTTGQYDDWHPIIHTYSLYVFSRILERLWFVDVCFIGIFAILCGWLMATLQKYRLKRKYIVLILFLLIFNPISLKASWGLWKDSAFAYSVLCLSIIMIHLWHTHGEWLFKIHHFLLTLFVLIYAAFVRHNGILFVLPFLIFLPMLPITSKKKIRMALFSILALFCLGGYIGGRSVLIRQGIVSNKSHQSFSEAIGLPMSMLSEAFVRNRQHVPDEASDFLLQIAPYDVWKNYYRDNYNSVKFATSEHDSLFEKTTLKDFVCLFVKTIIACPRECGRSFVYVSSLGWNPIFPIQVAWNSKILTQIKTIICRENAGLYIVLLLISGTYAFIKKGMKTLFMVCPFVAYSYGTALLLTGWDYRFFWAIIMASPCIILTLLLPSKNQTTLAINNENKD